MKSLLVALAVVALSAATSVAGAQAGEPFTVSPSEGGPFTVVDVTGEGCVGGPVVVLVVGTPQVGVITQFSATPDADGDWATTFTVPPNKPAGAYQVTASCGSAEYERQPFTILPGDTATMTVSPTSGRAGTDLTVTVAGNLCRGESASVDVGIFLRTPEEFGEADEFVARGTATPDATGSWTLSLTIPGTVMAGTYGVGTQCIVAGQQFFIYPVVDVTLSAPDAPPATPVAGRPRLTG